MIEVLTLPTVFPALGPDVSIVYRTHPKDLLAQKVSSPPTYNSQYFVAADTILTV